VVASGSAPARCGVRRDDEEPVDLVLGQVFALTKLGIGGRCRPTATVLLLSRTDRKTLRGAWRRMGSSHTIATRVSLIHRFGASRRILASHEVGGATSANWNSLPSESGESRPLRSACAAVICTLRI
jgi:hypothetical protein